VRIDGDWLDRAETQAALAVLRDGGHQALLVGGCVRNALMGRPVDDVDIATDARPERVVELAEARGLRAVPTGIEHGTVTLVVEHLPFEVTTFRRDVATDGRRAVVAFTDDVSADAARRDFTMNALYADAAGAVIDPLGGLDDLRARRVRFVGDAARRIAEDRLRVLRFFRFHAWYGDPAAGPDRAGLAACAAAAGDLGHLSRERIGAEMLKLLAAPDPAPALAAMDRAGVLAAVLPGSDPARVPALIEAERRHQAAPDAVRRLALLGGTDPQERLRLSRADERRRRLLRDAEGGLSEIAWRHGSEVAWDMALLRMAAGETIGEPAAEIARGAAATFPVRAADLPYEGAALGRALAEAEARWIASGFTASREELLSGTG
jgi:poly(A) polymerase